MRANGSGAILITGASASLRGSPNFGSFAASKSSLRALAQSLAKEEATNGVHVAHVVIDASECWWVCVLVVCVLVCPCGWVCICVLGGVCVGVCVCVGGGVEFK